VAQSETYPIKVLSLTSLSRALFCRC